MSQLGRPRERCGSSPFRSSRNLWQACIHRREEARQAVFSSSLAEEINLAQRLAAEIVSLIDLGKHELAGLRSNDLYDRTLTMLKRWDAILSTESKDNLLSATAQLGSLRRVTSGFSATAVEPSAQQLSQMQRSCRKIKDIFVEEHASAMKRND